MQAADTSLDAVNGLVDLTDHDPENTHLGVVSNIADRLKEGLVGLVLSLADIADLDLLGSTVFPETGPLAPLLGRAAQAAGEEHGLRSGEDGLA